MDRTGDSQLFDQGPAYGAKAKVLVVHFDGAMDAGISGRMAVSQMLRSLQVERVATFDSDLLIDYRSHRPVMTVERWVSTQVETPTIALDLVHDDLGHPLLLLHGPEPDAKWETFARVVADIAHEAGVEIAVSLTGIPSGVPHTRPVAIHMQATEESLLPEQPQMANIMQFPAPMTSFLKYRLAERKIGGISILGAVPYYMAEAPYPAAASALLRSLSDIADLSLPVGDLERGAAKDQENIDQLLEANPEIQHTVESLEEHYDAWTGGEGGAVPLGAMNQHNRLGSEAKESKDIGDVIEAYLANISRQQDEESSETSAADASLDQEPVADTLEAVLKRVEERRRNPGSATNSASPRHRAPKKDNTPD
ncbi:proteasome assembly chaperone family protein [Schaalia vaccimaxillae]|uniref:proteasome assembly chaperone family protein n=1 Tax=Schaalia vaccimaxillae TaxID=183916 RepID=UPI0003B56F22|nr:PAC2 family protein [Schaalia vaccimaxillae]